VYTWKRKGYLLNTSANASRYTLSPNTGALIINSAQEDDDGMYQCFAKNQFGTSVSQQVKLSHAYLKPFAAQELQIVKLEVGKMFSLWCNPPDSNPPATIYWAIQQLNNSNSLRRLTYDSRVTQDLRENLWFANLLLNDTSNGAQYVCVVVNEYLGLQTRSGQTRS
jgi:hypothetical protein